MTSVYYFCIETNNGIISIPIKNIEKFDMLTVGYKDMDELGNDLLNTLNIDKTSIARIYIDEYYHGTYKKKEINGRKYLPIKYKCDNFNEDSLIDVYARYMIENPDKIEYLRIFNYLKNEEKDKDYIEGRVLYNRAMFDARRFLQDQYRERRNAYYELINDGYKVKINKTKKNKIYLGDRSIGRFTSNVDYYDNLIEEAKKNPERYDDIMDEIAGQDIEYLKQSIEGSPMGIVDGMIDDEKITHLSIEEIAFLTGNTVDDLYAISEEFNHKSGKRR